MIRKLVLATALAASMPTMVVAQPASAATPNGAALAKARELMTVMRTDTLVAESLDAQAGIMTKGLADRLLQSGIAPPEMAGNPEFGAIMQRYLDRISAETTAKMKALVPQIVERTTAIYARNFSAAQLADVIAFYRTSTGQALLAKTPALSAEAAEATRDLTQGPTMEVIKELLPPLTAELKAWADKHARAGGTK